MNFAFDDSGQRATIFPTTKTRSLWRDVCTYIYMCVHVCGCVYMEFLFKNWFQNTNLSIHIARFSASESPRAYINTQKSPFFAGSWHFASGDAPVSATAHAPASHMFISIKTFGSVGRREGLWIDRFVFWNQFLNKNSISRIRRNLSIHIARLPPLYRRWGSMLSYQR